MSVNAAHFDDNQVPTVMGVVGTLGTADTAGTAKSIPIGVNPATGAMYVEDLSGASGTTNVQMVSGTLNVGTVVVSSSSGGTTVNVATGTQQTLGTVGVVNNLVTGTLASVGTLPGVGVVSNLTNGSVVMTVGTMTTGSLSNVAMLNAGTVNASLVSNTGTIPLITTVSNLTNGSVNILTGTTTLVSTVTTVSNLTNGTVRINYTHAGSVLLYRNTLGTAGAAFWGTLVAPVGAGTFLYVTRISVVGHTGTVDCGVADNVAGSTGAGVMARGWVPAGGGYVEIFNPPLRTVANGTLAYFLNGAGTASFNIAYWVSP